MIEMKVKGIAIDSQGNQPAVILTDEGEKRFVPIWIGLPEATAIFMKLQDQKSTRPFTHDLMKSILDGLKVPVVKVVISDVQDNIFYARIFLGVGKEVRDIDARPSDAIALALRAEAPIFVSEKVILEVAIEDREKVKSEAKQFKEFLKNVSIKDFIGSSLETTEPNPDHRQGSLDLEGDGGRDDAEGNEKPGPGG